MFSYRNELSEIIKSFSLFYKLLRAIFMERLENNLIETERLNEMERWANYREANDRFPEVRSVELAIMKDKVSPQAGEIIVECGTGNGYLTFPMAEAVGSKGRIITYDPTEENLKSVEEKNKSFNLPIDIRKQTLDYSFAEQDESVDKVATIATFHHYDNKKDNTGTSGRLRALKEFARILKKGGKLILGDVAKGTKPQEYFDSIDNPKYCFPSGHPHEFMDQELAKKLCEEAGLEVISFEILDTSWVFTDDQQAREFLHTIHNAKVTPEESLQHAKQFLIPQQTKDGKLALGWKLFYLIAEKL